MIVSADKLYLYSASNQMLEVRDELKRLQFNIEQLVFSTCDDWQGAAEKVFAEKVITINEQYARLCSFIDDCACLLKQFADEYEAMDKTVADRINRI